MKVVADLEHRRVIVVVEGRRVDPSRLPDFTPLLIDNIAISRGGAIVMEGEAWYEHVTRPGSEVSVTSSNGVLEVRVTRDKIIYRVRHDNRVYTTSLPLTVDLNTALNPSLIALRALGTLRDPRPVRAIAEALSDEKVRDLIRSVLTRSA